MKWFVFCLLSSVSQAAYLEGKQMLKNPIVMVHGATMGGNEVKIGPFSLGTYFKEVPQMYGATGTDVKVAVLPTDGSIEQRGAVLKTYLDAEFPGRRVNLICHSLGGLDARYAASILNSERIASITTIATPHHGSPLATWAVKSWENEDFWYWTFRLFGYRLETRRFLPELVPENMEKVFNVKVENRPDIRYYSVRSRASFESNTMSWLLWLPEVVMKSTKSKMLEEGNDGLVPFSSQAWGKVIADVNLDHLGEINHHEFRKDMTDQTLKMYTTIYEHLFDAGL